MASVGDSLPLETRTSPVSGRDEWAEIFAGTDACVTPVLDYDEALGHPHLVARESFVTIDGLEQPAPAPRFSRTSNETPTPARSGPSVSCMTNRVFVIGVGGERRVEPDRVQADARRPSGQ
jgi:CoA-transferase family III